MMTTKDAKAEGTSSAPGPDKPDQWERIGREAKEQLARMREEDKPRKVSFKLDWLARKIVGEAIQWAKEHTGTNRDAKALHHICEDYLINGPKARAMRGISMKSEIKKLRLEEIMEQMGPVEVMATYDRVFPAPAIVDHPK